MAILIEDLEASVQYNDIVGAFAADAHQGSLLIRLGEVCGLPDGYIPIHLSTYTGERLESDGTLDIRFWCINTASLGKAPEGYFRRVQELGECKLSAVMCRNVPITLLLSCMKRFHLVGTGGFRELQHLFVDSEEEEVVVEYDSSQV